MLIGQLAGYKAVAYQGHGRAIVVTTEYARNMGARRLVRVEKKIGEESTVCLSNIQGLWIVKGNKAARVNHIPELWRRIPLRWNAREGSSRRMSFTQLPNAEYHGLSSTMLWIERAAPDASAPPGSSPAANLSAPAGYEYFFDVKTGVLLGWRAIAASGLKQGEILTAFDLGDREGGQTKAIVVQTDEATGATYRLSLQVDIPLVATVSPRLLIWRGVGPHEAKTLTVSNQTVSE